MPFYEYECSACGHYLEAMQKISDAPLRKCPACGRQKLARLMSAPVFRLKGSGWYETDFKSDEERKRNLAEHPDKDKEKEKAPEPPAAADKTTADAAKPAEKPPEAAGEKSAPAKSTAAKSAAKNEKARTGVRRPPRKSASGRSRSPARSRRRASTR